MDKRNEMMNFKLSDHLVLNIAVSAEEGDKIHAMLKSFLTKFKENKSSDVLSIDFSDIELINTAFLNAAIGQLYADFDSAFLNKHLSIINIDPNDLVYLRKTIETAIDYYKNPKGFGDDISKVMNND